MLLNITTYANQYGGVDFLKKENIVNWCYNQHFILNYNTNWLIFTALLFFSLYSFILRFPKLAEIYLTFSIFKIKFIPEDFKRLSWNMIEFCLILFLVLWIIQANGITYFDNILEFFKIKQTWQLN